MEQRKELSQFANRPGITGAFVKQQSKSVQTSTYNSNATVDWILNQSDLGYLPLQIDIPWRMIHEEAQSVRDLMLINPTGDTDSKGWYNFGIFTKGSEHISDHNSQFDDQPADWTNLAQLHMPETVRYFRDNWPAEKIHRIRLLGLEPGGVIGLHTDDCKGLNNINIAIDHPAGCDFVLEHSGIIPFENGSVFLVNTGRRHAVVNQSDKFRLHLVVYQDNDVHFGNIVLSSYRKYHNAA